MSNICRKLEKTCQNARQRGNQRELAQALEDFACYLADQRDWDYLVQVRTELLEVLEKVRDNLELARCHRFIGEAYLELRDPDLALRHVKLYLKLCQNESELEKQRAFTTLGRVYVAKFDIDGTPGALDKATQFYNSALLLAMKFEKDKQLGLDEARLMRGRLLYNLALAAQRNVNAAQTDVVKHLERAVYTLKQLAGTKLEKESSGDMYNALCELSEVNAKMERSSEAVDAAKKALTLARQTKSSARRAESYMLLGVGQLSGGHWKEGRKALNHARVYAKSLDDVKKQCLIGNLKSAVRLERWTRELEEREGDANELNEKVGDTLAKFGFLKAAIRHYKRIEPPLNDKCKRYAAVCGSIAETFNDLADFESAEEWYLKELQYRQEDEYEELCSLYLSLIHCFRKTSQSEKVVEASRKAVQCAERCTGRFAKGNVLDTLKQLQEDKEIPELPCLENLESQLDEAPSSESSIGGESNDESSVDLSDLSIEVCSDAEERISKSRTASRRIPEKKNERGETLLQQECIKGNTTVVQKLISQGFDVNSVDNGGFSCLHDAANHGFFEIVKLLVEAGAVVNKESKDFSHRITPLHSASADGHYLIVSYLLDHGANAKALTIRGQTAFDLLEVSETQDELYLSVRERLEAADAEVRHLKNMVKRRFQHITTPSPFLTVNNNDKRAETGDAIVIEEDVLIRNSRKKKKQKNLDSVVIRNKRVRDNSSDRETEPTISNHRHRTPSPKRKRQPTILSVLQNMSDDSNGANDTIKEAFDRTLMCSTPTKNRRLDETVVEVETLDSTLKDKDTTVVERDTVISTTSEKSSSSSASAFGVASVHLVRVRVEDRLLSIPLPRDFANLNIGYLEKQAADRYQAIEGTRPVVNIALEDGALLCSSDPIVCVQGIPVLKGIVVSWNVPALEDRIKAKLTTKALSKKILHRCQVASSFGKLELDHMKVPPELFVVLKHEVHLHALKLNFVHLDANAVQQLIEVFARLKNLKLLALRGCGLKGKQFLDLFERFASLDLEELDLSFNKADNFFMSFLRGSIPRLKSLKSLSISSCGISDASAIKDIITSSPISKINLSCNPFGQVGVEALGELFRDVNAHELDLSDCIRNDVTPQFLFRLLENCKHMKTLKLNGLVLVGGDPKNAFATPTNLNNSLQLYIERSPLFPREAREGLETALAKVVIDDVLYT